MDYISQYFEVEWFQTETDEFGNDKKVIYKERKDNFSEALEIYLKKKEENYTVRLLSLMLESKDTKD